MNRHGEADRFQPFKELHNRRLLWHGSRTTNYAGILSQGLRIAPPEAPVVRSEVISVIIFPVLKQPSFRFTLRSFLSHLAPNTGVCCELWLFYFLAQFSLLPQ